MYNFEQSRIHQENIVKMHLLRRAIRRHYKMKKRALILNGKDVLLYRHPKHHSNTQNTLEDTQNLLAMQASNNSKHPSKT